MVIKRVGVWSVARMYGALSGAMGLIFGIIVAIASAVGMGFAEGDESPFMAGMLGIGAVIFLPIFYGVLGIVAGAIGAALYNVLAAVVGGVTIETE